MGTHGFMENEAFFLKLGAIREILHELYETFCEFERRQRDFSKTHFPSRYGRS